MENIAKKIVVQSTGKQIGYCLDIAFDGLEKIGYYVVDEESESEFLLKNEDIKKMSKEYLLIEDVSCLEFVSSRNPNPYGKIVLDDDCTNLGAVKEVIFKRNKCEKLTTDKCEILAKNVRLIGVDVIFVSFKKRRKSGKENFFPKLESDALVKIQKQEAPQKVVLSSNFYIGKICGQDIFGYNNERIVLKDEKITKNIVERAKKHNKLNQLFFAIKR